MIYTAIEQARKTGSFPTFRVTGHKGDMGLYTRTACATNLIAKNHPVGVSVDRPYQLNVCQVAFSYLTD